MDKEKGQVKVYTALEASRRAGMENTVMVTKHDYDQLKADFERVVKLYGNHSNYLLSEKTKCFSDLKFEGDFEPIGFTSIQYYYAGKLAREMAKKWDVEI